MQGTGVSGCNCPVRTCEIVQLQVNTNKLLVRLSRGCDISRDPKGFASVLIPTIQAKLNFMMMDLMMDQDQYIEE